MKKEIKRSALIKQALSQSNTPLVEPGTKVIESILINYIRDELRITEGFGHFVSRARTNTKLALAFARLKKIYFLETVQYDPAEKVSARIFRALAFVASTTNPELLADMTVIIKKGVNLEEVDPYNEVLKICDENNDGLLEQYFKTSIHAESKGKKIMKAVLNYLGTTAEAIGVSKVKAKERACEKWLEKYRTK